MTAEYTWYTGYQYNSTSTAQWSSNATGVATIQSTGQSSPGLAAGVSPGSVQFQAFFGELPANAGEICVPGNAPPCPDPDVYESGSASVTPSVTIQVQSGFLSIAGNGLVLLGGPGGLTTTAITASGNPSGGSVTWTAGPRLQINGVNSVNASVSGTGASTSGGDTWVSVQYTVNGQSANASVRFTVENPTTYKPTELGNVNWTTPYNSGNQSGYITTIWYYLYDQMNPANLIPVPGIPATETLSTISNPSGASFIPLSGQPNTDTSNSAGQIQDLLYAYAPGGLPPGFSASRSQSWTVNGFAFTPSQTQTYTQTYATVQTNSFSR